MKPCPICEHYLKIVHDPRIAEIQKSDARVKLANHQYFKHLKTEAVI